MNTKWTKKRIVRLAVVIFIAVMVYQPVYSEWLKNTIRNNDLAMTKVIVTIPGNVNFRFSAPYLELVGKTALDVACMNDNYEIMEILLKHGAKSSYGRGNRQPLTYVLSGDYRGLHDRTKLLVEYGAKINIGDGSGEQPLQSLFGRSDYRYAQSPADANAEVFATMVYLAEQGASFELNSPFREYRRLENTVNNGNYKATEYLVKEQGMDVNVISTDGKTLLMPAAEAGGLKIAELLIELGVDKSIKDEEGKTAYDYAIENGHLGLAELLKP